MATSQPMNLKTTTLKQAEYHLAEHPLQVLWALQVQVEDLQGVELLEEEVIQDISLI